MRTLERRIERLEVSRNGTCVQCAIASLALEDSSPPLAPCNHDRSMTYEQVLRAYYDELLENAP